MKTIPVLMVLACALCACGDDSLQGDIPPDRSGLSYVEPYTGDDPVEYYLRNYGQIEGMCDGGDNYDCPYGYICDQGTCRLTGCQVVDGQDPCALFGAVCAGWILPGNGLRDEFTTHGVCMQVLRCGDWGPETYCDDPDGDGFGVMYCRDTPGPRPEGCPVVEGAPLDSFA